MSPARQVLLIALGTTLQLGLSAMPALAQDSRLQRVTCHGPQTAGRLAPPDKIYVSGVSTGVYNTGMADSAARAAFRAFVREKYGADFEPRCDWSGSEAEAERWVKYLASDANAGAKVTKVKTGWVWSPAVSDTAVHPAGPPRPGALEH